MAKWRNIKSTFLNYEQARRKRGAARQEPPIGYDLLCSFLSKRPSLESSTLSCGEQDSVVESKIGSSDKLSCNALPPHASSYGSESGPVPALSEPVGESLLPSASEADNSTPQPSASSEQAPSGDPIRTESPVPEPGQSAKRRRIQPPPQSDNVVNIIAEGVAEVRRLRKGVERAREEARESRVWLRERLDQWMQLYKAFETRKIDLMETMLEEIRKK